MASMGMDFSECQMCFLKSFGLKEMMPDLDYFMDVLPTNEDISLEGLNIDLKLEHVIWTVDSIMSPYREESELASWIEFLKSIEGCLSDWICESLNR